MSEREFEDAVDRVAGAIEDIGYDPEVRSMDVIEEDDEEEQTPRERVVPEAPEDVEPIRQQYLVLARSSVGPSFQIAADEGDRYFTIQANYDLWRDLAEQIDESRARELVDESILEDVPEDHVARSYAHPKLLEEEEFRAQILAAFELLNETPEDQREELVYHLTDIFASAELKHSVGQTEVGGPVSGFHVYDKVFPFEDTFRISDLNRSIESVRMAAHRAELFLRYSYNLGVDIDRETAGEVRSETRGQPADPEAIQTEVNGQPE